MPNRPYRPYFIQLVMRDWLTDTARLSLAAQGLWARILCHMALEPDYGTYKRTINEATRELGCGKRELLALLAELSKFKTLTLSNDILTLVSHRMVRDESKRINNANRQRRFYHNANLTPTSTNPNAHNKKLDVRSHKLLTANFKDKSARAAALGAAPARSKSEPPEPDMTAEEMAEIKRKNLGSIW